MSKSSVEIDFFRLEDESSSKKPSDRRDIQGVISRINPELLKTAIASASADKNMSFVADNQDCAATVAPMTIFFNGSVRVFDVTPDQAQSVMKLAESVNSVGKNGVESMIVVNPESKQNQSIGRVLSNDLPLSRKRSLRRFLEKRKERFVSISPYAYSQESTSSH